MTDLQQNVLDIIKKNPVLTGKEIALIAGMKDRQTGKEGADLRSVINALRQKGHPICADSDGYWYATSKEDLLKYIGSLEGRIKKETEALNGLKACSLTHDFSGLSKQDNLL